MKPREKSGFLYPDPVSPYALRCITLHIPDEPKYRAAFWGHLWQLARPYTWYQNAPVPTGQLQEVAEYWLQLLWPDYQTFLAREDDCEDCMDCCPEPIMRFTDDGLSEVSTDNGETWAGNAGDPRFLPIPFLPRPEPPGEARRCNAAFSVRELLEQATDQLIATAGAWGSLQVLVDSILAIIAAIFPGVGTIAALIIAGVVAAIFYFGQAAFDAAMTEAVYDLFQCLIYCQLDENGEIDTAGWQQLKLDIYQQVGGIAGNWLWGWVSSLGPSGINASTGMFTGVEADCSDCGCSSCEEINVIVGTLVHNAQGSSTIDSVLDGEGRHHINYWFGTPESPKCCYVITADLGEGQGITSSFNSACDGQAYFGLIVTGQCMRGHVWLNESGIPFTVTVTRRDCEVGDPCYQDAGCI